MSIPHMTLATGAETYPSSLKPEISGRAASRFDLDGKTAVVTGGARGLGYSATTALLEHGVTHVAIFDLNRTDGISAVETLSKRFPHAQVLFEEVNVTDGVAVEAAVARVAGAFGGIDLLHNFAGIVNCQHAVDTPLAKWRQVLDVNTTGPFICAQAVAKQMIAQKRGGSITFISSISAHIVNFPQPQASYNVSKAAILHLMHSLAAEWAVHGIRVNSISPGYMDTVLNEGDGLETSRKIWTERTPLGRMGATHELDGVVILLSSSASSYITGTDIKVDGGITLF